MKGIVTSGRPAHFGRARIPTAVGRRGRPAVDLSFGRTTSESDSDPKLTILDWESRRVAARRRLGCLHHGSERDRVTLAFKITRSSSLFSGSSTGAPAPRTCATRSLLRRSGASSATAACASRTTTRSRCGASRGSSRWRALPRRR